MIHNSIAPAADPDLIDGRALQESAISLVDIRAMLHRQRWVILPVVLVALAIGLSASLLMTPVYEAVSTVRIEPDSNDVVTEGEVERPLSGNDFQRYLAGQIDMLKSRRMAARVADQLRLADNDDFLARMDVTPGRWAAASGDLRAARRDQVITTLTEHVGVKQAFGSTVSEISFRSPTPSVAIKVANAYADNLITGNIAQRYDATSYARHFLAGEIARAKLRLEESERLALQYAADHHIIDASDGVSTGADDAAPKSITTANLIQASNALMVARTNRIDLEDRWIQARQTPLLSLPQVQANAAIQTLQAARSDALVDYVALLGRYRKDHPLVVAGRGKLHELDAQMGQLAGQIRDATRNDFEVAQRQELSLAGVVRHLTDDTLTEQNKRVQLNLMARDVETNRTQYRAMLDRYKQVSTASGVITNNLTILDRAERATRTSPRVLLNLLAAAFVGLVLGFGIALLREMFDDSIRTPDDVLRKLALALLGTTPRVKLAHGIVSELADGRSPLTEAYAAIRASLEFSTTTGAPASLLVTSAQPLDGKTTTSISLAYSFARAGKRILLIDGDLRSPSIHRALGLRNDHGLVNVLTGNMAFEQGLQRAGNLPFDVLLAGPIPPNPSEIVTSETLGHVLAAAAGRYDHILIDGPPTMGLADAPQIARAVQGLLFVVESGRTMRGQTKAAVRRLAHSGTRIVGVVLSKLDARKSGYGAYYGYRYDYEAPAADA